MTRPNGIEGVTGAFLTGLIYIDGVPVTDCDDECATHMCRNKCGRINEHPSDRVSHICEKCAQLLLGGAIVMRQETSAPNTRLVNALTGKKAPDEFFKALSEADAFCAELDELHELRIRVAELESALKLAKADADDAAETIGLLIKERDGYRESAQELSAVLQSAFADIAAVRAERDDLASEVADLREELKTALEWLRSSLRKAAAR